MGWRINLSRNAEKFLDKNALTIEEIHQLAIKAIGYFRGENINVDIKKLKGEWKGFHRIRSGRIRIIAEFNFDSSVIFIEEIDWRGGAYK